MNSASESEQAQSPLCNEAAFSQQGFAVSLPGEEEAVRGALQHIVSALKDHALGDEEIGTVELVLAEVLNNVVEHAYPDDTCAGAIQVRGTWEPNGLHLEVRDGGAPMPEGKLPISTLPAVDVDLMDMPEGGFGWFLIQDLAKDVIYRREEPENLLQFRMVVSPAH